MPRSPSHPSASPPVLQRALVAWAKFIVARPGLVLVGALLLTVAALAYTVQHFELNSDTSKLVHQDAPFRSHYREFIEAFPHYDQSILVVVTAEDPAVASDSVESLAAAMRASPDLFQSVYCASAPDGERFFEQNALLYLDLADLERVIDRLAEAQSALTALAEDPSLRGLAGELEFALGNFQSASDLPPSVARITDRISDIGEHMLVGEPIAMRWQREFLDVADSNNLRLITAQPRLDGEKPVPGKVAVAAIRRLASEHGLTPENGIQVRLTGMVPLATEELATARDSVGLAALLSFVALTTIMVFGVRSLRVILATLTTVVIGIIWTAAFGLATVGEFNVLSMGFSVLLIGMSVDFAIHLCLRYLEVLEENEPPAVAAVKATRSVGIPVTLCAITSSIGFFSFLPTDYHGLAELGLVTGGGMFIALFVSLTVCPAVLTLLGAARGRPPRIGVSSTLVTALTRHAGTVSMLSLLVGVSAAAVSTRTTFDFSTLGTKDPRAESMIALSDLEKAGVLTDYALTVLAKDRAAVGPLVERLRALDHVEEVRTPEHYLPPDQDAKLELLEEAELFLWPALRAREPRAPPTSTERVAALERLRDAAQSFADREGDGPGVQPIRRLASVLTHLSDTDRPEATAAQLEELLVADLPGLLDWLRDAIQVEALAFDDLPEGLRQRLVAQDGRVAISVLPREDLSEVEALSRFVDEVGSVTPHATGRASVEAGIGEIVVRSFYQAVGIAAVTIVIVLLLALRSFSDTLLVLVPLALAAFGTIAIGVLFDIPFNMTNVIAIPLIMGLGVDNGIHVLMRYRREGSLAGVLESSTPRAIILSGLTTLGAFGALSVSTHLGIRSAGLLLSISLMLLMVSTVIVLPALLAWRDPRNGSTS